MAKILIIDDDALNRQILKEALKSEGFTMIEAEDGESGIQIVLSQFPDIVITDYLMPGMNGLDVLSEILKINRNLPVIILTGHGDVGLTIKSIQMGAYDFLEKPVKPALLKSVVNDALNLLNISRNLNGVLPEDVSNDIVDTLLVGKTAQMKEIFKNIGRISMNKANVMIQGETGTGKELIARLIHYSGITREKPLVTVNCSALTESLLESELFGHVKGSFTGSIRDKSGKFELAGEGTIFLDEISEISLNTQVKLLRVIQELEFEKVGGENTIPMKARIIAATNKDLEELIKQGKFREDLYYRLKVFTINLPPLRERKEDIRDLIIHFLHKLNKRFGKNVVKIGDGVIEMLQEHDWHGNVRELENTILQAIVMSKADVLEKDNITFITRKSIPMLNETGGEMLFKTIAELEKYHIKRVLDDLKWNKVEVARYLDITRPTLNAKIEKYNLA
jgi:two-component system, NtrC family, response regulator AtoC